VRLSELYYDIGAGNVAAEPSEIRLGKRGLNRMLHVQRKLASMKNQHVRDLPKLLRPGDVVVLNNSKRIPGVLYARFENGAQVELRVVAISDQPKFTARLSPQHFAKAGAKLSINGNHLCIDRGPEEPYGLFSLTCVNCDPKFLLKALGYPIPSFFYDGYWNVENYNPFYAKEEGSVESPMAGVHFSAEIISALLQAGVQVHEITHHVEGSWLAPLTDEIEKMELASEAYSIPQEVSAAISATKSSGGKVLAVGSTCVRALESASGSRGIPKHGPGRTSLSIKPGYQFKCVDAYLTSFHPSRTSLIVLDAAFCGSDLLLEAYRYAAREQYFFLEFGDAILYD
jgi:S-adenosylmethionine:tRNA ribosyltransferase-isomerase